MKIQIKAVELSTIGTDIVSNLHCFTYSTPQLEMFEILMRHYITVDAQ